MAKPPAEIASINSSLEDLTNRLGKLAEEMSGTGETAVAHELYEVERLLTPVLRRMSRLASRA